jgi:regulator of replication initiation timing
MSLKVWLGLMIAISVALGDETAQTPEQFRARVPQLEAKVAALESDLGTARKELAEARESNGRLVLENARLRKLLQEAGIDPAGKPAAKPPEARAEKSATVKPAAEQKPKAQDEKALKLDSLLPFGTEAAKAIKGRWIVGKVLVKGIDPGRDPGRIEIAATKFPGRMLVGPRNEMTQEIVLSWEVPRAKGLRISVDDVYRISGHVVNAAIIQKPTNHMELMNQILDLEIDQVEEAAATVEPWTPWSEW